MNTGNRISYRAESRNIALAYFLFGVIVFLLHCGLCFTADDIYYHSVLDSETLSEFLRGRYLGWSSRTVIEGILVMVARSVWAWRILDSLIMCLMVYILNGLAFKMATLPNTLVTMLGVLIYPFSDMGTAGFASTTINYLWPLVALLVVTLMLHRIGNAERRAKTMLLEAIPFLIFVSSSEITSCLLFVISSLYVFNRHERPERKFAVVCAIFAIVGMVNALVCPGNHVRVYAEIATNFPTWGSVGLFDKIYLSTAGTTSYLLNNWFVLAAFFSFCFWCFIKRTD